MWSPVNWKSILIDKYLVIGVCIGSPRKWSSDFRKNWGRIWTNYMLVLYETVGSSWIMWRWAFELVLNIRVNTLNPLMLLLCEINLIGDSWTRYPGRWWKHLLSYSAGPWVEARYKIYMFGGWLLSLRCRWCLRCCFISVTSWVLKNIIYNILLKGHVVGSKGSNAVLDILSLWCFYRLNLTTDCQTILSCGIILTKWWNSM